MIYLASIGLVFILKYSSAIGFIRRRLKHPAFVELFKCSLCLGFWAGACFAYWASIPILYPFASAAVCWIADTLLQFIQGLDKIVEEHIDQ